MNIKGKFFVVLASLLLTCISGCITDQPQKAVVNQIEKPVERDIARSKASVPKNRIGEYPDPSTLKPAEWLGLVPDADLTPGIIDPCIHAADICSTSTRSRRNTTSSEKTYAKDEYLKKFSTYSKTLMQDSSAEGQDEVHQEIDHLIPLEVGGADVEDNLWPQPSQSHIAGASDKDQIENHIKSEMCAILKANGASQADSYLAMMQRVISAGFKVDGHGNITPPMVTWYHLYVNDIAPFTDGHGTLNKKHPHISFANSLIKYRAQIRALPAPKNVSNTTDCQPPQP